MTYFTYEKRLLRRGSNVYFGKTLLGSVRTERPSHRPAWYTYLPVLPDGTPLSGGHATQHDAAEALLRYAVYNMPL
jgi:hypothetical protein